MQTPDGRPQSWIIALTIHIHHRVAAPERMGVAPASDEDDVD